MPASEEEEWKYWDARATELRRTQLATVQASALKWSALLTSLLGVFSAVAFAGGLTTLDKLEREYEVIAKITTSVAVVAALGGVYFLAKAAGGLALGKQEGITASSIRRLQTASAKQTLRDLSFGKASALCAAALVVAGSFLVLWVGEKQDDPKTPTVVAVIRGQIVCGPLQKGAGGGIRIGDVASDGVSQVLVAPACP